MYQSILIVNNQQDWQQLLSHWICSPISPMKISKPNSWEKFKNYGFCSKCFVIYMTRVSSLYLCNFLFPLNYSSFKRYKIRYCGNCNNQLIGNDFIRSTHSKLKVQVKYKLPVKWNHNYNFRIKNSP